MGFDLFGVMPDTETGQHFRNSCWCWRPLWEYVCQVCPDILDDVERDSGNWNNGDVIPGPKSDLIAERLEFLLKSGDVKRYEEKYMKELNDEPDVVCEFCHGTGKRNDEFVRGTCNACDGKGSHRPESNHYPFSEENVREFAEFCKNSGGFEIS